MKNQHNTNSSSSRFTTDTPQRENEQTTRSFTMRNMGRGLLLGLSLSIAAFSVATAQTGSLQGRRVILNDGGLTPLTFNRIQLNTPADGSLTGDYNLILPPSNGAVDNILFVQSVPSAGNSQLNFTSGDHLFWKLTGNNTVFVDGTNNLLGTLTADPLNIITGGTMRIRVTAAGNVGIGAGNAPTQLFAVGGGAGGNLTINAAGNLVTAGNLTINGTGTNTIGVAATTNTVLGTTGVTGNTTINNSGIFTTDVATGTNSGLVTIGNNANGGGITMSAGTTNLVLNNIANVVPAPTDFMVWMTAAGNNVRRTLLSGTADQGLMHEAGQYRLGNSTNGLTPIVTSRFVRVGAGGTLTFNTATTTALVINNGGLVDLNTVGGANTNIGSATTGTVAITGLAISGTAANVNLNTTLTGATTIGSIATGGAVNIRSSGVNPITIDPGVNTNNVVMNNIATGVNSNDVLLITGTNQVRRLASNQFAWLITGNGHVVTDNVNNLLGTTTAADLRVITNNVTRMVVNGTGGAVAVGNVGIGTTADATYRLAIAPNATGNGILVTGAPVVGLRIEDPSGTGISVGAITAPATGIVVQAGATGMTIGSVSAPTTLGLSVRTAGAASGITVNQGGTILTINEGSITRIGANIAIDPGAANLVTTNGNITVSGANTNTIGVAGTINNITGATASITGSANVNVNTTGNGATSIGSLANVTSDINISSGKDIIINTLAADPSLTSNLILNGIDGVNPIDDILWITAGTNRVRRTPFTGTADEGIQFNTSAYRLGHLVNGNAPIVNPRFVRVGAAGTLTFNTATTTSLVLNNTGQVGLNTLGGANTNIGSATTGTVAVTGLVISGTAANVNVNTTLTGATTIGSTATGGIVGINSATSITSLAPNVNMNNSGTGATTVGSTVTGGIVGINSATSITSLAPNVNLNNSGTGATTVGSTATGGIVGINSASSITSLAPNVNLNNSGTGATTIGNATGTGITMSAGTSNIVMNLVTSAAPGALDDILWITNVGNNVRRTGFSGLANEGIQYQNSAFRLGASAIDVNPVVSSRFVTVGAAGTLRFHTAASANNMLTLNNNGIVDLNVSGGANTNIGSATTGTVAVTGLVISGTAANVNVNTTLTGATTIGSTATGGIVGINSATSITSLAPNVNMNNSGTGATTVGSTVTGGIVGINSATSITSLAPNVNLNNSGTGATTVGSTATGGIVGVNSATSVTLLAPNVNINNSGTGTATIGSATGTGITMDAGIANIVMNSVTIATPAATDYNLWSTGVGNNVRRQLLSGTADQGLMFEAGQYRLGNSTNGLTPIVTSRFVRVGAGGTLTFNTATTTALVINNLGQVDLNTVGGAATNIGSATTGTVTITGATIAANAANVNIAQTAGNATAIGNATGNFSLTSNQLNVAVNGNISNAAAAVVVNDAQGLVVNSGGAADLTITEAAITRAGALLVDQGAAATLTLGNTAGTVTVAGVSGTPNITATSLATNSLPAFVHPTDGIVVVNGSGVLRRRPVTDLINASNGVIYNETGTDAEVRLGTLAAGTGALTNALAGPRFVNLGTLGILSFNRGAGTNNMLSLNGATGVVTIDGTTTNINTGAGNNTVVGNATGTFGLTSTQLNINSANGELSDAVGAVTVNDVDGLVVNTGVASDLTITETTISRVNADININPGGGNILRTDGSMTVDRNLIVDQTTNLGNGSGADNTTIAAGTGTITLTGTTLINATGSGQTSIGDLANSSAVNVRSQTAVNLLSDGNVNIQTSGNGDVVIGTSPTTQTLTINADIRGSGPNKFAERVVVNGTGVAAYTIANGLATAGSVILVTLESYSGAGILSYQITNRAATSFTLTFSNNLVVGETVAVHYMIINP